MLTIPQVFTDLGSYVNQQLSRIYDQVERNPNIGLQRKKDFHSNDPRLTKAVEVTQRMHAVFVWMPGNLFYGPAPNLRSDDPGDQIEHNAGAIIGKANYDVLEKLNTDIVNFNKNRGSRTVADFERIIDNINIVGNKQEPYAFNPRQWEKDASGKKFRIKLNAPQHGEVHRSTGEVAEVEENPYEAAFELCQALRG